MRSDLAMRVTAFEAAFAPTAVAAADGAGEQHPNSGQQLLLKLVEVLQHVEELPLLLHDSPGSRHGLDVLSRQLRFQLRRPAAPFSPLS